MLLESKSDSEVFPPVYMNKNDPSPSLSPKFFFFLSFTALAWNSPCRPGCPHSQLYPPLPTALKLCTSTPSPQPPSDPTDAMQQFLLHIRDSWLPWFLPSPTCLLETFCGNLFVATLNRFRLHVTGLETLNPSLQCNCEMWQSLGDTLSVFLHCPGFLTWRWLF